MSDTKIIVVFGYPGAGKTYVGNLLNSNFNYHQFEADTVLPDKMKQKLLKKLPIEENLTDEFFDSVINKTHKLVKSESKIVITQAFVKEKYRKLFLKNFPYARFILVEADDEVRNDRLKKRNYLNLTKEYVDTMIEKFDKPTIKHHTISNNSEGSNSLLKQLKTII